MLLSGALASISSCSGDHSVDRQLLTLTDKFRPGRHSVKNQLQCALAISRMHDRWHSMFAAEHLAW